MILRSHTATTKPDTGAARSGGTGVRPLAGKTALLLVLTVALLALSACAPAISNQSLDLVDRDLKYAEVAGAPSRFIGRHLLVGGEIVRVRNSAKGAELEMVQHPVDERGSIVEADVSEGRFLAVSDRFLDPAVYRPGLKATLVGEVAGEKTATLDETEYRYPVLGIREIHLWKPDDSSQPAFHFGIGIGTFF